MSTSVTFMRNYFFLWRL